MLLLLLFFFALQNCIRKCPLDTNKYTIFIFRRHMAYAKSAGNGASGLFLHWQTDSLSYRKSIQSASVWNKVLFMLIHVVNTYQTRPISCTTNTICQCPYYYLIKTTILAVNVRLSKIFKSNRGYSNGECGEKIVYFLIRPTRS